MNIDRNLHRAENPLVSVVVVTYNSSNTVVETLESIKGQTYKNIELIITDDCSKDDTIDVVQQWLGENDSRFVYTELVTTKKNSGVSGNLNRGIRKSHGDWIKSIAGDDHLIPSAIEEYIGFIQAHEENIRMCVCDIELFSTDGDVDVRIIEEYKRYFQLESESYEKQRKRVMGQLVFVGPTYFYSRELYDEIGGFSDKYGCAEEWPFCYKVIRGGNQIYALNKKLVRYRVQSNSLCHTKNRPELGNKLVFDGMYNHFFDYPFKDLIKEGNLLRAWHYALYYWGRKLQFKSDRYIMRKLIEKLSYALSPLYYLWKFHIVNTYE